MLEHPFDPHPYWRRNFEFTAAYTVNSPTYTLDPILPPKDSKPTLDFKLDPILNKYALHTRISTATS